MTGVDVLKITVVECHDVLLGRIISGGGITSCTSIHAKIGMKVVYGVHLAPRPAVLTLIYSLSCSRRHEDMWFVCVYLTEVE